jgi:hypothetical protein
VRFKPILLPLPCSLATAGGAAAGGVATAELAAAESDLAVCKALDTQRVSSLLLLAQQHCDACIMMQSRTQQQAGRNLCLLSAGCYRFSLPSQVGLLAMAGKHSALLAALCALYITSDALVLLQPSFLQQRSLRTGESVALLTLPLLARALTQS